MNTDENIAEQLAANIDATQVVKRKTAAAILDCHISHVDTLINNGELETVSLGTHCKRITLASINELLSRAPKG